MFFEKGQEMIEEEITEMIGNLLELPEEEYQEVKKKMLEESSKKVNRLFVKVFAHKFNVIIPCVT